MSRPHRDAPDIRAITLDLDDTLWAVGPVIVAAEEALQAFLATHAPSVAERFPIEAMRDLRARIAERHPHLAHDFTAQRRLSLQHALAAGGGAPELLEPAFDAFIAARNRVTLYPDAAPALERLSARLPLAAITNGNADLGRIGLMRHFRFQLGAREFGAAKPHPSIFHAACERLGLAPQHVLHVGDCPEMDVRGAQSAGLLGVWLNRHDQPWSHRIEPDLQIRHLGELVDWIERRSPAAATA